MTNKPIPITPASVGDEYDYLVGVDTPVPHNYAIITAPTGALIDERTFPITPTGVVRDCDWIARRIGGDVGGVLISAEAPAPTARSWASTLAQVGYRVVEAPTPRRERGRGKTDAMNALTAARGTLAMPIGRLRDRRGAGGTSQNQVALQVPDQGDLQVAPT